MREGEREGAERLNERVKERELCKRRKEENQHKT